MYCTGNRGEKEKEKENQAQIWCLLILLRLGSHNVEKCLSEFLSTFAIVTHKAPIILFSLS